MSEFFYPPPPDEDPLRPGGGGLPSKRQPFEAGKPTSEEPQQQISLDEMMERLKRSGSGERSSSSGRRRRTSSSSSGERRVSRRSRDEAADASHHRSDEESSSSTDPSRMALPSRRRREKQSSSKGKSQRRSSAPRRNLRWIFWLAALVLLALGTWYGIRLLNRWRIEGEGFRVNASRRLSELADRRISTARFRQTAKDQLNTATLALQPAVKDLLATATISNLTADFAPGSSLADDWTLRSLRLQQIDLTFQPARQLDEQNMWLLGPAPVDRGITQREGFRLGMTSDPASVIVEQGSFDQLNLTWPGPDGKPESLTRLQGNFRTLDQSIQVEIAGGLLDTSAWPPLVIQQINAKLKGTSLEIIGARLGLTAGHEIRVSGSAELIPEGSLNLNADIQPVLLKHVLPDLWANTVLGSFEATGAVWTSHFKSGPAPSLTGPFRVKGFVLRALPFVDKIASILRKPELALLEFPVLSGTFQWNPGSTQLSELSATTADGLLRLHGKANIAPGETLSAELVFEANEAFFPGIPPETAALFTPGPEGWRSLAFTLGGRETAVTDSIGIRQPIIIQHRPEPAAIELPRMTLPPGVVAPGAEASPPPAPRAAPVAAAPVPGTPTAAPPATPRSPAAPRQPSDAELERQFKDLLGR